MAQKKKKIGRKAETKARSSSRKAPDRKAAKTIRLKATAKKAKPKPKPKPTPKQVAKAPGAKKPSMAEVTESRVQALAKVFATLGARNAERWARTHVDNGSDELGRFVLLRAMWLRSIEPGRLLASGRRDRLAGPALERLMNASSLADLDALVRFAQRTTLDDVCRVLDDPANDDDGIRWGVFRIDAKGVPLWTLDRLRTGLDDSEP